LLSSSLALISIQRLILAIERHLSKDDRWQKLILTQSMHKVTVCSNMSFTGRCDDYTTCAQGNCIGCKDGQIWCADPRCEPYCSNCAIDTAHDFNANIVTIIILACLAAMLLIMLIFHGPTVFPPKIVAS
jgi:hypothetical protein